MRMLAVPVDDSMVYAELNKSGVCLGMTGVGRPACPWHVWALVRIEQAGARCAELKEDGQIPCALQAKTQEDTVLILPKPTRFSSQRLCCTCLASRHG